MEEGMEALMLRAARYGDHFVDLGNPFLYGEELLPECKSEKSTDSVCGYSILKADCMNQSKELLKGHFQLTWDGACKIEIHEAIPESGQ
jgi:hypothetical protein